MRVSPAWTCGALQLSSAGGCGRGSARSAGVTDTVAQAGRLVPGSSSVGRGRGAGDVRASQKWGVQLHEFYWEITLNPPGPSEAIWLNRLGSMAVALRNGVLVMSAQHRVSEGERPVSEQALIDQLLETFASSDYQPPLLPGAALQLLTLSRDPNVAFSKIIALLESEPLIVARVIRTAQSPFYSGGARIRSIEDAVLRMGIKSIALVFAEAAMNAEVFSSEVFQAPMQALRAHSTATAHIARKLAERLGQPGDRTYLCGLLHDIGIAACLLVAPALKGPDGRGFSFEQLEAPIHAVHEQAGEVLSSLWNMPEGLRWIFAHHHNFALRTHISPVPALVCLASWVAGEVGAGVIHFSDAPEASIAARHFGWAEQLGELVEMGNQVALDLRRGES
jgi:HD-like signal output (HDOD) protein